MNKAGPPKKNSILELAKLMDAAVRVKCLGGRELQGTLRGYDELVNLVLDDCDEFLRGKSTVALQYFMLNLAISPAFL
jgi:U6 snRNA-associated Sm-like protein LSm7